MKVEYNLDHSHFKVTCDKCFKDFTDEQIDKKDTFCRCPHCHNFICGMGYLVTRERKGVMKSARVTVRKSSGGSSKPIKTKLMKRKVRVG
jgi:hypothetical protein